MAIFEKNGDWKARIKYENFAIFMYVIQGSRGQKSYIHFLHMKKW